MMRAVGRTLLVAAAATQLVATACNDSQGPQPDAALLPLPLPGLATLAVSTSTSGSNLDPDGYTVTVDGGPSQSIGANGVATFVGLAAGDHTVLLSGVAQNCTVSGANPRTVSLIAGLVGATGFSLSCAAQPTTGDLAVSTSTTGSNLDPNGYALTLDGGTNRAIPTNGSVTFTGLPAGSHTVVLSGVAGNCTPSGGTSRTVDVSAGGTASTSFAVSCVATPPPTGNLTVSTSTTGSNPDPDRYALTLDGGTDRAIPTNGSVTFTGLPAGSHTVVLSGVAGNCTPSGGTSRTVDVAPGGTASTTLAVRCVPTPPPAGNPTVPS